MHYLEDSCGGSNTVYSSRAHRLGQVDLWLVRKLAARLSQNVCLNLSRGLQLAPAAVCPPVSQLSIMGLGGG
ncbi:uncharacterized protein LOC144872777 isoform X2 [Branchiostoma floridae x Branchiostoma japonicum]